MPLAYLNGEWAPASETRVSVLDRGFLFGDGVYEVISAYNHVPFELEPHLDRLERSLREIRIQSPMNREQIANLIQTGLDRSGHQFALVYLQITRGAGEVRDHVYPDGAKPTVFLMITPAPKLAKREVKPLSAITLEDYRWGRGHIKSVSILANGLLRNEAVASGVDDAILVRNGYLTESSASNVFVVIDGQIRTPPKSEFLLHGITRDLVIRLAREQGMDLREVPVSADDLKHAEEIWVTNTSAEVWPVGVLDGKPVNNGGPGPVWADMDAHYQAYKHSQCGNW